MHIFIELKCLDSAKDSRKNKFAKRVAQAPARQSVKMHGVLRICRIFTKQAGGVDPLSEYKVIFAQALKLIFVFGLRQNGAKLDFSIFPEIIFPAKLGSWQFFGQWLRSIFSWQLMMFPLMILF